MPPTLGGYGGQLDISLMTCPEVVPDGAQIARDLHHERAQLLAATPYEQRGGSMPSHGDEATGRGVFTSGPTRC
jgi:hypothetical protein